MAITWLKLCHDIPTRKEFLAMPVSFKWAWITLLCEASKSTLRGIVQGLAEDIACLCGFQDLDEYQSFIDRLRQRNLIEFVEQGIKIANWETEQYIYPSQRKEAVAERVRKCRQKKKEAAAQAALEAAAQTVVIDTKPVSESLPELVVKEGGVTTDVTSRVMTPQTVIPKGSQAPVTSDVTRQDIDLDLELDPDQDPDKKYDRSVEIPTFVVDADDQTKGVTTASVTVTELVTKPEVPPVLDQPTLPGFEAVAIAKGKAGKAGKPGKPNKQPKLTVDAEVACEQLRQIYNDHRPSTWAECSVLNLTRTRSMKRLMLELGYEKTCEMFEHALEWAKEDNWWNKSHGNKFSIDTLLRTEKNWLVRFYENWQGKTASGIGDLPPGHEAQDAETLRQCNALKQRLMNLAERGLIDPATIPASLVAAGFAVG